VIEICHQFCKNNGKFVTLVVGT